MSNKKQWGLRNKMLSEEKLINKCLSNDSKAQKELYNRFAPKMWGVCLRFAKNAMIAEDILQEGFIKVFCKLEQYTHEGSFEGWIRRTMINTAINYFKKNINSYNEQVYDDVIFNEGVKESALDGMAAQELLTVIQKLPEGYRLVFNLHAIEGYTHKEISKMLNISENTSKSQLSRARNALQKKIKKKAK